MMHLFNVDAMGGRLCCCGVLMCRFDMAMVSTSSHTWVQIIVHSCSTVLTMEGSCLIVLFWLADSSTFLISFLTNLISTAGTLVSSPFLPIILCNLTVIMPRDQGKTKHGPSYYNFIARHTIHVLPIASSQPPTLHDVVSPSITQNWDVYDSGPVFLEEEVQTNPFQPMEDPLMASPVNPQSPLVPPVHGEENSPEQKLEEYCGFHVLEEMDLVFVEEEALENVGWITEVTQTGDFVSAITPQQSFFVEQLQLIFDLRRDTMDQRHRQEILNRRQDMVVDSLSS
jgi:hypothetical protein